ncbi:hypothetical protein [Photobacterium phosphoreum]|uniref:hypothetical protein n=1 Tax=Photobacterium phosphoreum TaxID=659 RepID=UPI00242B1BD7|nr:hypothetical protein [Photobacterium phosphoreum]
MKIDRIKKQLYEFYAYSEFTLDEVSRFLRRERSEHTKFSQIVYTHQMLGLSRKREKEFSLLLNSKHELGEPVDALVNYHFHWLCLSYQDSESVLKSKISYLFEDTNKLFKQVSCKEYSTDEKPNKYIVSLPVTVIWQSSREHNSNCIDKFGLKVQGLIERQGWEKYENSSKGIFIRTNDHCSLIVNISILSITTFNFTSTYVKEYIDFLNDYEEYNYYNLPYNTVKIKFLQWLYEVLFIIENQSSDILLRLTYFKHSLAHILMDAKADDLFEVYPSFKLVLNYYLKRVSEKSLSSFENYPDLNFQLSNKQTSDPWDVLSEVLASIHEHDLYHVKKSETLLDENDLNSLVLHSLKQRSFRTQKELPVGKNRVDVAFECGEFNIRCECEIAYKNSKLDKKGIEKAINLQAPSYVMNNPGNIKTGIVFYLHGDDYPKAMDDLSKFIGELGYLFIPKGGCNQMHYELSSGKKAIEPTLVNVICVFFESKSNTVLSREQK